MKKHKVILWDFDGTLAFRPGRWSGALVEVLRIHEPDTTLSDADFRPYLQEGFPWHRAQEPHPHLASAEQWWAEIEKILARAYQALGIAEAKAQLYASEAHARYLEPTAWQCFADVVPALTTLLAQGWQHAILSNHVPELTQLVEAVGLNPYFAAVFTSAQMGYEKPHPEIFRSALAALGHPTQVWMIGDNYEADVVGAEAVGIPAILVRSTTGSHKHAYQSLPEVVLFLERSERYENTQSNG